MINDIFLFQVFIYNYKLQKKRYRIKLLGFGNSFPPKTQSTIKMNSL